MEGEGEWNARKHWGTKRGVWRKIHFGIDEKSVEIRAAEFTASDVGDAPMLSKLLDQIPPDQKIVSVIADGAFDTRKCHDASVANHPAAGWKRARRTRSSSADPWSERPALQPQGHALPPPLYMPAASRLRLPCTDIG